MDERALWLAVRRALLLICGAIERRYALNTSDRRAASDK
jgi:hypothetical protein